MDFRKYTRDTFERINNQLNSIKETKNKYLLNGDAPNGKFYRTYNQREVVELTGLNHKTINSICEKIGITYKDGNKWCINQLEYLQLQNEIEASSFHRPSGCPPSIWVVSILKGGAGKTTTTVTLAAGLAQQLIDNYKVLVIDLDPQCTATHYYSPLFSDDDLSIGDLMMKNFDSNGVSFKDICLASVKKTNIPHLDIIGARDEDRVYDLYVKNKEIEASQRNQSFNSYRELQEIIENVQDEYDVILLDTPPHFSAANIAAHYVANNILIPIKPAENDWDSATKYFSFLDGMFKLLSGLGHQGYQNIKVLISAQKGSSRSQERIAQKLRLGIGNENMMTNVFPESDAVQTCAETNCTIFDISESEYMATKKVLKKVQIDVLKIVHELETYIREEFNRFEVNK